MTRILERAGTVTSVILCGAAAALSSRPLSAQTPTDEKWEQRWTAAVGVDPFTFNNTAQNSVTNNFSAVIAREWSQRDRGLSWRVQLAVSRQAYQGLMLDNASLARRRSLAELGVNARYTFLRKHSIRPYLTGGPSLFADKTVYTLNGAVFGGTNSGTVASTTVWSLGATAGVGLSFRLFRWDMFVEQRLLVPELTTRGAYIAHPFTLGVRF
jgi:hypothetical protein